MPVNIHQLVKECILEVLKENLLEGFDPQSSAGPNPASCEQTQHDPYKAWNAKMRKMEENDHGRYAQLAGAGQFDQRTFGVNEADKQENLIYKEIRNGKDVYWVEDEINGGTTALSSSGVAALIRQGYKIVELDADPRSAIRQPDPDMANYMGDGDRT